jgi:hypothetical protein
MPDKKRLVYTYRCICRGAPKLIEHTQTIHNGFFTSDIRRLYQMKCTGPKCSRQTREYSTSGAAVSAWNQGKFLE